MARISTILLTVFVLALFCTPAEAQLFRRLRARHQGQQSDCRPVYCPPIDNCYAKRECQSCSAVYEDDKWSRISNCTPLLNTDCFCDLPPLGPSVDADRGSFPCNSRPTDITEIDVFYLQAFDPAWRSPKYRVRIDCSELPTDRPITYDFGFLRFTVTKSGETHEPLGSDNPIPDARGFGSIDLTIYSHGGTAGGDNALVDQTSDFNFNNLSIDILYPN